MFSHHQVAVADQSIQCKHTTVTSSVPFTSSLMYVNARGWGKKTTNNVFFMDMEAFYGFIDGGEYFLHSTKMFGSTFPML